MASVKQLFGQTGIYGLGTILPRFLNYLLTPLYTYLFSNPADYGINAELYAYISFFNVLFTYGMETAYFYFANKHFNPQKIFNTIYSSIVLSTFIFSFLLILFSKDITQALHYHTSIFVYWTIGILATDALLSIPFAYLRQQTKPLQFSILKISNVILNILFNLFFFLICKPEWEAGKESVWASLYKPEIGIGYSFLSNLLANVTSIFLMFPVLRKFRFEIDFALWKDIIMYALPLVIVGLAGMINETFDRIVLKYLLPQDVAQAAQGIYGACYKISILMTLFIQAYRYAAEPFFFKVFKDTDAKNVYAQSTDVFIAFGLFIWLVTVLNVPVLQYFIGPSYRVGLNVVPILLTANLCLGIYFNLSFWYKLTGKTQYGAYLTLVGAVITLIINFMFVPRYSYLASAWATLAAYFTMMLLAYFLGQHYYKVNYPIKRILSNIFVVVILYILSNVIFFQSTLLKIVFNNLLILLFVLYLIKQYRISINKKI